MGIYNKLLVAIDLSDESGRVIDRALEIADQQAGKVSLIHVVEPVAAAYPIDAYAINMTRLQEEALEISAQKLADIGKPYGVDKDRQLVSIGSPSAEIRAMAEELECDLIVIGSHGTSGWKLLLGSTANKLLHGAKCDILTVRVGE